MLASDGLAAAWTILIWMISMTTGFMVISGPKLLLMATYESMVLLHLVSVLMFVALGGVVIGTMGDEIRGLF